MWWIVLVWAIALAVGGLVALAMWIDEKRVPTFQQVEEKKAQDAMKDFDKEWELFNEV